MPFDGCVSLVRLCGALRGNTVGSAGGEAVRRAEMREPKCALNLPTLIGQTPPCPVANPGSKQHRPPVMATEASASRRYGKKPDIAVLIGRRIFNRPFGKDVNAGVIAFGETDCDQRLATALTKR